jgi:EAL domain-containing protein (putative c-di-GMP-specific phosphodiesterase class I)
MIVVAEGVETLEQYTILLDMQCQFGQGYLFSKPLPKPKIDELIEEMLLFSQQNPGQHYPLTKEFSN